MRKDKTEKMKKKMISGDLEFLIDVQEEKDAFFNPKHLHFFLKFKITFLAIGIVA
jgi:hypothetical protein